MTADTDKSPKNSDTSNADVIAGVKEAQNRLSGEVVPGSST